MLSIIRKGLDTRGNAKDSSDDEKIAPKSKRLTLLLQKPCPGLCFERINGDGK